MIWINIFSFDTTLLSSIKLIKRQSLNFVFKLKKSLNILLSVRQYSTVDPVSGLYDPKWTENWSQTTVLTIFKSH